MRVIRVWIKSLKTINSKSVFLPYSHNTHHPSPPGVLFADIPVYIVLDESEVCLWIG